MEERSERPDLPSAVWTALESARETFPSMVLERVQPDGARIAVVLGERHLLAPGETRIAEPLLDMLLSHTSRVALEGPRPGRRKRARTGSPRLRARLVSRLLFGTWAADFGPATLVMRRAEQDPRLEIAYLEERGGLVHLVLLWILGGFLLRSLHVLAAGMLLAVPVVWACTGEFPGHWVAWLGGAGTLLFAWRALLGFDLENPGSRLVLALPRWLRFLLCLHEWDLVTERDRAMSRRLELLTVSSQAPCWLVIVGERHLAGLKRELATLGWSEAPARSAPPRARPSPAS